MSAAFFAAGLVATVIASADAFGQLNVVSWRPSESGQILICEDEGCSAVDSVRQDEEPRGLAPGKHMFEVDPGDPEETPSAIFGAGVWPEPRPYLLHVPSGYKPGKPATLWVHAPGTNVHMETVYRHNKEFAEKHNIAMLFLSGLSYKMNVRDKARSHTGGVWGDDVAYTEVCLRQVMRRINVDRRRIFCVGFSRGARFCSRLASELSSFFAAIAGVAGLRYPEPNNATKPIPIIAFHAMHDEVNPYRGGGPLYWGESIPAVVERWGFFNGCNEFVNDSTSFKGIEVHSQGNCTNNATVLLFKLLDRGHNWPRGGLPINVREEIHEFFRQHSDIVACHSVGEAEFGACAGHMRRVRRDGFKGLSGNLSLREIQEALHRRVYADCPLPCPPEVDEGSLAGSGAGEKQDQRVLPVPLEPVRERSSHAVQLRISMVCFIALVAAVSMSASFCKRHSLSQAYGSKCPTTVTEACAAPLMALPTMTTEPLAASIRRSKVTGVPASPLTAAKPKGKRGVFVI